VVTCTRIATSDRESRQKRGSLRFRFFCLCFLSSGSGFPRRSRVSVLRQEALSTGPPNRGRISKPQSDDPRSRLPPSQLESSCRRSETRFSCSQRVFRDTFATRCSASPADCCPFLAVAEHVRDRSASVRDSAIPIGLPFNLGALAGREKTATGVELCPPELNLRHLGSRQ